MPSSRKFWNLKSLQGALFHADHFGMNNAFCPKSDLDIYFIRLAIFKLFIGKRNNLQKSKKN